MLSLGELLIVGLWVYALVDVAMTDKDAVRNLPKLAWILLVAILFFIGALGWFIFGRPQRSSAAPRTAFGPPRSAPPRRVRPTRAERVEEEGDIEAHIAERDRLLAQWADEERRKKLEES
jgi:hypothetical protein